jgi:hypothetical protein
MTVGRFIEQASFRLRACDFYRELLRLAQDYGWGREQRAQIENKLLAYEEAYRAWRANEAASAQPTVYVGPGQDQRSDLVWVYCKPDGSGAVVQLLPELLQIRFRPPGPSEQWPHLEYPREDVTVGQSTPKAKSITWAVRWPQGHAELYWDGKNSQLTIQADRVFTIPFRR